MDYTVQSHLELYSSHFRNIMLFFRDIRLFTHLTGGGWDVLFTTSNQSADMENIDQLGGEVGLRRSKISIDNLTHLAETKSCKHVVREAKKLSDLFSVSLDCRPSCVTTVCCLPQVNGPPLLATDCLFLTILCFFSSTRHFLFVAKYDKNISNVTVCWLWELEI